MTDSKERKIVLPDQSLTSEIKARKVVKPQELNIAVESEEGPDKYHDIRILLSIDQKIRNNQEPTKDELASLYGIGSEIKYFSYERNSMLEEIRTRRDFKKDLSIIYNCSLDQIVDDSSQITWNTRVCLGDLNQKDVNIMNNRQNGLVIFGYVFLNQCDSLTSIPKETIFHHGASFFACTSLTVISPGNTFEEDTCFDDCYSLAFIHPNNTFKGKASFNHCDSLKVIFPGTTFNGSTYFSRCTSLTSTPETTFNGHAGFSCCSSLTTISEKTVFNGDAYFGHCVSLETIPENTVFNGFAYFRGCHLAKGLKNQLRQMKEDGKIKGKLFL